jgi:hypothetical protein
VLKDERYVRFASPTRPWERNKMYGLPDYFVWDSPPRKAKTLYLKPDARDAVLAREQEEYSRKLAEQKKAEAHKRDLHLAHLAVRDAGADTIVVSRRFNLLMQKGKSSGEALDIVRKELMADARSATMTPTTTRS